MGMSRLPAILAATPLALALCGAAALAQSCPKTGGTLTYVYSLEPTSLSTIATSAVPVALISTKIYESLLTYEGPALTPKPGLAESWTISDDKNTYTFKLRPGVTWHDGKPFTAQDVKFSVEDIIRPYHSRGKVYFGDVEAVETPDDLTVVFKLKAPVPFFMNVFQPGEAPIMPRHAFDGVDVKAVAAVRAAPIMQNPVGTGPFRFKEWRKGSHITLERNPGYWRKGFPCLDQVVQRIMPDGAARAIAIETGEVDLAPMSSLPEAEVQRLEKIPALEASQAGAEALGPNLWLEVNMRDKPLADLKVRQALSLALDRERIVD